MLCKLIVVYDGFDVQKLLSYLEVLICYQFEILPSLINVETADALLSN